MSALMFAEVVPEKFGGLPTHPLLVHLPVLLVPLAAIFALVALVVPRWRTWSLPITAVFAGVGLVGVQLAIWSGEGLEEASGEKGALIERHSELAIQSRPLVLVFFLVALAAAVLAWRARREPVEPDRGTTENRSGALVKAVAPLCALSLVFGAASSVWMYRTGHAGAKSVWKDSGGEKKGGVKKSGGEKESGDGDADGG